MSGAKTGKEPGDRIITLPTARHDNKDLPVIDVVPGLLPATVDAGEAALLEAGAEIYQSGGRLVAIGHEDQKHNHKGIQRPEAAPRLIPVTPVHLREQLTRSAIWQRYDARAQGVRDIDCPMAVATALVDRGRWKLRELVAYVEAPTVREDGTPLTVPGYDEQSGLYLLPGAPQITLTKEPSYEDAVDASRTLCEAVGSWPYVGTGDHAAAVATIPTMLYARSVDAVPMPCVTSPTPGSGKSLLIDAGAVIATGRRPAVMTLGKDTNEAAKRLASGLLAGDSPLAIDNVETVLGGDLLCQAVTQPYVAVRPLGSSVQIRAPARVCLCATGNNLVIRGDLTRRVMLIQINAGMEHPEQRSFDGDILADLAARRSELIAAAITITTAYHAAGCPDVGTTPLGGFAAWDRLVRRPLVWAGLSDPLMAAASVRDDDPDRAALVALLEAMRQAYGDRVVTAAEIINDATKSIPRYGSGGFDYEHPALHDAVHQVCGKQVDARRLGYALRRYRSRIVEGMQLDGISRYGPSKVAAWRVICE
ncbi:hypothetical protein [Thiohalobacter thiocyanaticus]|uniref:Uncharacterized protein n=1 Tax=Thiohalobacter thiocyanaticus TaxID=585455 RepID=A0A426QG11_9GAMM|nr:hypothetical protein [Thiohalobacter thiocyanaticus]RRQ20691.1 hypothetical protein D6C00_00960 [Thiohalobacter thiocyanaticus]